MDSVIRDYGYWVRYLQSQGFLAPEARPSERVLRSAVQGYVRWRVLRGNHPNTIVCQLSRLRRALGIMEPRADFSWLTRPNGHSIRSFLPKPKPRTRPILDSRTLYQWGVQLMEKAEPSLDMSGQQVAFRDGLLIALLAARAPRVRSMISLRIGKHVTRVGDGFWLTLEAGDLKAGSPLEYSVPEGLTPAMERYMLLRDRMLGTNAHDLFWVGQSGRPLARRTVSHIIRTRSKERFGFEFGPHRFRHAIGTSAAIHDPARPAIASAILNNSSRMVELHYNIGGMLEAAHAFHADLKAQRAGTKSLARRELRKRAPK